MGREKWHIEEDGPVTTIDPGSVYEHTADPRIPGKLIKLTSENPHKRNILFLQGCGKSFGECRLCSADTQPVAVCNANLFLNVPEKPPVEDDKGVPVGGVRLGPKIRQTVYCGQDPNARVLMENAK